MPVVPYRLHPFQDCQSLYQFLLTTQTLLLESTDGSVGGQLDGQIGSQISPQIISISLEIEPIDPLAAVQELATPQQPFFFWEKPLQEEAIATVGVAYTYACKGAQRFQEIQACLQRLQTTIAQPKTFNAIAEELCYTFSFTFFDQDSLDQNVPSQNFNWDVGGSQAFAPATLVVPKWQILRRRGRCFVTLNLPVAEAQTERQTATFGSPETSLISFAEATWQEFQRLQTARLGLFSLPDELRTRIVPPQALTVDAFQKTVLTVMELIQRQQLHKLVLAHAVDIVAPLPFQWVQSLHNLRRWHPDCCTFAVSSGRGKTFLGASPERLIQIRDRHLITDALAGSAPRGRTTAEDIALGARLLHTPKERHEHQLVVDFLRDRLTRLGLSPQLPPAPTLLKLSNIQHLHTPITAVLPPHQHPLELVAALHPTPAVAGLPRDAACEAIQHYETFGRSLYAAPLGWIDQQGNAEFIVGIRSALLHDTHARLYAGAGIVAGSDPERELAEIQLKLQVLLQALI